ncbi:MAG: pirin family protein [Rhodospirillaceae bacterium]
MIDITPLGGLGRLDNDWLAARYHFSFAGYRNPDRRGLGPLLVWNDDTIQPGTGFDPHGHRDMEIITYVRKGAITHSDNLGNEGRTAAGDVQVMSAGTGIVHAEYNREDTETTLFQIWIEPDRAGHAPRWETRAFPKTPLDDGAALPVLASGRDAHAGNDALLIHQDAAVLGGLLAPGATVMLDLSGGRKAYVVVARGKAEINGRPAPERSGAMVRDVDSLIIVAEDETEIVVVDVP